MSLTNHFVGSMILDSTESKTKTDIVRELLQRLAADGHIAPVCIPSVLDGIMRRESLSSTGIGRGVAVPHTKHSAISRRIGILGVCRPAVDFDSLDAEPADLIFLILAPTDTRGDPSMRVTREAEELIRQLRSVEFCDQLRRANSEAEIGDILSQPPNQPDW